MQDDCPRTYTNDFAKVEIAQFKSIVDNDTLYYNEARYMCANSASYIKKVMYDAYGKWDNALYPKGEKHPILVWESKQLSLQDKTPYTIAATGAEEQHTIYTSFLAFDTAGNDLLKNEKHKQKLVQYFKDAIRANDSKKRDFYEVYWMEVDSVWYKSFKQ